VSTNHENDSHPKKPEGPSNFLRHIIDQDLASNKHQGRVVTRFPPEPNGYLHIGHAKSICLNFGLARDYQGACHLRFDDTNPEKEDMEYVESIQKDVRWLGFDWQDNLFFASDYYEKLYELAQGLIRKGKAYVCSLSEEEIREYRGTVNEAGKPSPYRERSVEENLDLFERMRQGEFAEGTHVLRANIDMAAANMKMRDPLLYRIKHTPHYRRGSDWCLYPMYDFAHCLSDALENITHSICTLEFENNRELYDWIVAESDVEGEPHQYEFARLNLSYTVMSKRKLLQLVQDNHVHGWDDPRMPTVAGMRRRGYTPEAIRDFADRIGVAKANSLVDVAQLEFSVRNDLNYRVPRVLAVLKPLKVVLTNLPEGHQQALDAPYYPSEIPKEGSRVLPLTREIYIDRDDFMEEPPKKFFRLAPGREVRLRHAYVIKCEEVIKDENGEVIELRCTADLDTLGKAPEGRKVKGIVQWVSAEHALDVEVRLYDRLFTSKTPGAEENFLDHINSDSLTILQGCKIEPSVATDEPGTSYQFERLGFFCSDTVDSKEGALVFNRTVTLRDTWDQKKKEAPKKAEAPKKKAKQDNTPKGRTKADERAELRAQNPEVSARYERYKGEFGLSEDDADILSAEAEVAALFEAAVSAHNNPTALANLVLNEVMRELKDSTVTELPFGGTELGELVKLLDEKVISSKIAKQVFAEMAKNGGSPATIVEEKGLKQVTNSSELEPVVEQVLANNPDEVERFKAGEKKLQGFFVGQVMKATRGKANPKLVNELLRAMLS
jgi:glutaminyl-tRNA synthetase